jgi:aldose 1-epimerase
MHDILISSTYWGSFRGRDVFLFRITGPDGTYVELTNYGATVVSIVIPDRYNHMGHVVLGFPNLQGYLLDHCYLGSTVGRFANRIANGRFHIDGAAYQLETNDGVHSNHSGAAGFNSKVFEYEVLDDGISFSYLSPDGEGGFPGELQLLVKYTWKNMELLMEYTAETSRKTPVNITNHCYFNLSDGGNSLDQELTVFANRFLETTPDHIPTGALLNKAELLFNKTQIGARLPVEGNAVKGLNTCYVLEDSGQETLKKAAVLFDPASGRSLQVSSTYPGLLLYTGDYLSTELPGHYKQAYKPFDGLCLECQYYPDTPNHPDFPSTMLHPDQVYRERIAYQFHVED